MAIDSSIALQTKLPQFDNPLTQLAQFSAIQQAQSTNRLADLTYSEKQREVEQTNALNKAYSSALGADGAVDRNKLYTSLASSGLGSKLPTVQKAYADQDKASADLAQSKSKTAETDGKLAVQRQEAIGNTLGAIAQIQNATPQHVVNGIQHLVDIGTLAPEMGQKIIAGIPQDPTQLKSWLETGRNAVMKAADQMKYTTPDANTVANNRTSIAVGAGHDRTSIQVGAGHDAATLAGQGKGQVVQGEQGTVLVDPRTGEGKPVMVDGQPMMPKLKDLPAPIQKAYLENGSALGKIDRALAAVDEYPEAFGSKNMLGDAIRQRTDPKGVNGRALVADIGSLKIHDRSGAAVTAAETPRLKPFIPDVNDHPDTIKKKLALFQKEYQAIQDDIAATYTREQGFRAPGGINLTKVKPNTPEFEAVMADAARHGALRGKRNDAAAPAKPSLDDIFGKK